MLVVSESWSPVCVADGCFQMSGLPSIIFGYPSATCMFVLPLSMYVFATAMHGEGESVWKLLFGFVEDASACIVMNPLHQMMSTRSVTLTGLVLNRRGVLFDWLQFLYVSLLFLPDSSRDCILACELCMCASSVQQARF